jgi:hypothetical protein
MKLATRLSLLSLLLLPACDTTRDVASTSFHVVTAPVRFVHRQIFGEEESPPPPPPPANAPVTSDVSTPGQPMPVATPTPPRRSVASSTSKTKTTTATSKTRSSASAGAASASTQFPTAKPVPGRPGLVLNPFGSGYIDVSGYAPGSKVKDPDSQKIFIVP